MKNYFLMPVLVAMLIFQACSSNVSKKKLTAVNDKNKFSPVYSNTLPANKSTIEAEAEGIYVKDSDEFFIRARILKSDSNPGFANYAIAGASYILSPKFRRDSNNNAAPNKNLSDLTRLKAGDTFKAEISFEQFSGWYIEKVLK